MGDVTNLGTPEDRAMRIAAGIEVAVLADPELLGSMVGLALGYVVEAIRKDPTAALADLDRYGRAVGEATAYVLDGAAPGPTLRGMLGEGFGS